MLTYKPFYNNYLTKTNILSCSGHTIFYFCGVYSVIVLYRLADLIDHVTLVAIATGPENICNSVTNATLAINNVVIFIIDLDISLSVMVINIIPVNKYCHKWKS